MNRFRCIIGLVFLCGFIAQPAGAEVPSIAEAARNDFQIGTCLGGHLPDSYPPAALEMVTRQFNAVTPENCMKPQPLHPSEDVWNFADADALVNFAQEHHMSIYVNTLVWHSQTPGWFFRDGSRPASRDFLLQRMHDYIHTVVGRFKGKVKSWDVVNEGIKDNLKPNVPYLRESNWERIIGPDYMEYAFRFAHEADPDAELQYNDYLIEEGQKHIAAMTMLKALKAKGVPITSVGIQGHFVLDRIPFDQIDKSISDFQSLGLKVAITELDLDVVPRLNRGASVEAHESTTAPATQPAITSVVLQRQADQYARLFAIFKKHRDAIERVTFWGADDGHSWLNTWPRRRIDAGLIFDRQFQPKAAFYSILKELSDPN